MISLSLSLSGSFGEVYRGEWHGTVSLSVLQSLKFAHVSSELVIAKLVVEEYSRRNINLDNKYQTRFTET
jgi:hypothetical protein